MTEFISQLLLSQQSWKAMRSTDQQCMRSILLPAQDQEGFGWKARIKVENGNIVEELGNGTPPLSSWSLSPPHCNAQKHVSWNSWTDKVEPSHQPPSTSQQKKKMHSHASCFTKYIDFLGSHEKNRIELTVPNYHLDHTSFNFKDRAARICKISNKDGRTHSTDRRHTRRGHRATSTSTNT